MKGFRCNNCGLDGDGEPKTVVQDRADCSFGEVAVCPDCGSDDINIGEFTLDPRRTRVSSRTDRMGGGDPWIY